MMKKITPQTYAPRFANLAKLLLTLPEKQWDFSAWVSRYEIQKSPRGKKVVCGTVCCAAGHLPHADPKHWEFIESQGVVIPMLKERADPFKYVFADLDEYFGMSGHTSELVFTMQGYCRPAMYRHVMPVDVADKLVIFAEAWLDGEEEITQFAESTWSNEKVRKDREVILHSRDKSARVSSVTARLNKVLVRLGEDTIQRQRK